MMNQENKKLSIKCGICKLKFLNENELKWHMIEVHDIKNIDSQINLNKDIIIF